MRYVLRTSALLVALLMTPSLGYGFDLCRLLGLGCGDAVGCGGCGCDAGCGCGPACGCDGCGSDVGCGCEPTCGCGGGCGCDGRQYGGQTFTCCNDCGPPLSPCVGPDCGGCEPSCGCGCGDSCGCGDCGCEPACGCGSSCDCNGGCCSSECGFGQCCGRIIGLLNKCCGCSGCDSELYWSEWHNDPPRCCDPCDRCGNWVGPSYGHDGPYESYPADGDVVEGYYTQGKTATPPMAVARRPRPTTTKSASRPSYVGQRTKQASPQGRYIRPTIQAKGPTRGQMTRKPNVGPNGTYQR
jgi:hypothetical protein